jgi:putative copper resistance protein D
VDASATFLVCKMLHIAAAAVLFGAGAFILRLPQNVAAPLSQALAWPVRVATIVVAGTALLWLPLQAAAIGNGLSDAADPVFVWSVLTETGAGRAWLLRALLAVCLVMAPHVVVNRHVAVRTVLAAALLASVALTGHAVMPSGWLGAAHQLNHAVHLLAGAYWLGAMGPLVIILKDATVIQPLKDIALARFSSDGLWAAVTVVVTGAVNTALILGTWPVDWSSPYQRLLSAKIAAVMLMLVLAVSNRTVHTPRLRIVPATATKAIAANAILEMAFGALVLLLVGILSGLDPA